MIKFTRRLSLLVLFITLHQPSFAQMFSADESDPRPRNLSSFITLSVEPIDFNFNGPTSIIGENGLTEFNDVAFKGSAVRLGLETFGLSLSLAAGGELTGIENESYLNIAAEFGSPIVSFGSQKFFVILPVSLNFDLTSVEGDLSTFDFRQSSFYGGAGAGFGFRIADGLRFAADAVPSYGFSTAEGGFFGGSIFAFDAGSQLVFTKLLPRRAVGIGYQFKFKDYDIDEDQFDYDLTAHQITIGFSF